MTRPHLLSLSSEQLHLVMRRADKLPRRRLKRTRSGRPRIGALSFVSASACIVNVGARTYLTLMS